MKGDSQCARTHTHSWVSKIISEQDYQQDVTVRDFRVLVGHSAKLDLKETGCGKSYRK